MFAVIISGEVDWADVFFLVAVICAWLSAIVAVIRGTAESCPRTRRPRVHRVGATRPLTPRPVHRMSLGPPKQAKHKHDRRHDCPTTSQSSDVVVGADPDDNDNDTGGQRAEHSADQPPEDRLAHVSDHNQRMSHMNMPEFKITAHGVVTNPADPDTKPDEDEDTEPEDDDEMEIAQWLSH